MADAALAMEARPVASSSGRRPPARVSVPRHELPLSLLVAHRDLDQHPEAVLTTRAEAQRVQRDIIWASKRESLLAAAAAGVHLVLFAYNLAFWGFEGTPPDRYWPHQPRVRLQVRPKPYGWLQGCDRVYYKYLSRIEGVDNKG